MHHVPTQFDSSTFHQRVAAGLAGIKAELDEFAKASPAEGVDIAKLWAFIVDEEVTLTRYPNILSPPSSLPQPVRSK